MRADATSRDKFRVCCVALGHTLEAVLRSLDVSGMEIVLVEDADGKAVGVVTDGDVRRALLRGAALDSTVDPFVSRTFASVSPLANRAEALDLMQSRRIGAVPIVGADGRFAGLHALHELLGAEPRPHWAVIMAGGRGERLRPLTDSVPKPMIKVAGRPILERLVWHLIGFGIRRIFLSVNYMAEAIEQHFGDGRAFGCAIEYLRETQPLGTGGALSLLPSPPTHPVIVMNGDLLTQVDLASMLEFHTRGGYRATMGVRDYSHTVPLGVVDVDGDRVVEMREKPTEMWRVNAGIYVLNPEIVARVPPRTFFLLPALVEECLERKEPVGAFHVREDWMDVGQHHELKRARGEE